MTVNEVRSKLLELKTQAAGPRTVEFVCDNQKYFLTDVEKGPSEFKIIVTRKNYRTLPIDNFLELLSTGNQNSALAIFNTDKGGENKAVSGFYLSDATIEIAGA